MSVLKCLGCGGERESERGMGRVSQIGLDKAV